MRPVLYKVEVPIPRQGRPTEITAGRGIDAVRPVPWVVLSKGVELDDFPRRGRGGVPGRRVGHARRPRGLDGDLGADDPAPLLRERAVPRLERLAAIVDAHGRPWREKRVIRGVIEGFYGPPWTHAERLDLIAFCGARA